MSSTQSPLGPPGLPDTPTDVTAADEHAPACGSGDHAHLIQAGRGAPPSELLAEMVRADATRARMAAAGEVVRFHGGGGEGPLLVELCELDGTLVRALSLSDAIALTGSGME